MAGERKLLHFDKFVLDLSRSALCAGELEVPLRLKSFEALSYLVQNAGRLVSKDELIEAVWRRTVVTDDSLAHCLSDIREALGDANHRIVKTVRGRGYLFAATVFARERTPGAAAKADFETADYVANALEEPLDLIAETGFGLPLGSDREGLDAFAVSNIPIRVPTHFMGRDEAIEELDRAIHSSQGRVAITALHGLRGVGKTTLAAAYAERHRTKYRVTWWIRAQSSLSLRADLFALGIRLGWVRNVEKEEAAVTAVMERLRYERAGVLLIFDNAASLNDVRQYLPLGGATKVIITSNAFAWRSVATPIEIGAWPREIGGGYLVARTGRGDERDAAGELSEALGGLPLAHEQAAAYCERLELGFADYLGLFEKTPATFLDDARHAPPEYYDGRTVAKTYALSIEEAARAEPIAEPLIAYASLLPAEAIPVFLFIEGRDELGGPFEAMIKENWLEEAVAALRSFALVDRLSVTDERGAATTDSIRLHRLVRQVAAAQWRQDLVEEARRSLLRTLARVYPSEVLTNPQTWPRARRLDALVLGMIGDIPSEPQTDEIVAGLWERSAKFRHGRLTSMEDARFMFQRALLLREASQGHEHPDVARTLNSYAFLLMAQGDLVAARPLYERALAIRKSVLGRDHLDTAQSLNDLARLMQSQGEAKAARPLFERALAIREKLLKECHPDVAHSLDNLARLHQLQGALDTAKTLLQRALSIREAALGSDHPDTAISLSNLARLMRSQGESRDARRLYERALEIRTKMLGLEHPATALSMSSLASLLVTDGDVGAARELHLQSLAIMEEMLGPEHPVTTRQRIIVRRLNEGDTARLEADEG
jgi:DNA-binding winged helix-turn-helix (wHTH) protein